MRSFTSKARCILLACAALLVWAAPASAGRAAEVSIMDDQLLLGASQATIDGHMQTFRSFGVDRLRVSAFWDQIAPSPASRNRPAGFNAADPASPGYNWDALDRVVSSAARFDIRLMVSITTPAPLWATGDPARENRVWKPRPGEFADFAEAVVRRYAPFVDHWGMSNEPNQGAWLQPQGNGRGLVSPHLYRDIVQAMYPRIQAFDPGSVALLGELASSGTNRRGANLPVRPLAFLRAMGCRDGRLRRTRRGPCRTFRSVPGDAFGHHPYNFFFAPTKRSLHPDDAAIGDGRRLLRTLDALTRRGAIDARRGRRLKVFYTEFGYQTRPPDPFAGVSLGRQRQWLQDAAFLVWRTPRIAGLNQFRLTDGAIEGRGPASFREFQSGLAFRDGRRKPAYGVFAHPFVIQGARFWGQARPGGAHTIRVAYRRRRGGRFRLVAQVPSDRRGYFSFRLPGRRAGEYRYSFSGGSVSGRSHIVRVR